MTTLKKNLAGRTFGDWTVLRFSHRADNRQALWLCRCSCGTERAVRGPDLTNGRSTHCPECIKVAAGPHGRTLYKVWHNIRQRCENPEHRDWGYYGARGIEVCERWQVFANFYADMAPTYRPGLTVDRMNVDGPYAPDNCRWATRGQQARNKRNNRLITFCGRTAPLVEWAELLHLDYRLIQNRLNKLSWPVERALSTGADPSALACLTESAEVADHRCVICQ